MSNRPTIPPCQTLAQQAAYRRAPPFPRKPQVSSIKSLPGWGRLKAGDYAAWTIASISIGLGWYAIKSRQPFPSWPRLPPAHTPGLPGVATATRQGMRLDSTSDNLRESPAANSCLASVAVKGVSPKNRTFVQTSEILWRTFGVVATTPY